MAADNDLSKYAYLDLYEMEAAGSTPKTDIIVQLDDAGDNGTHRLHMIQSERPYEEPILSDFENKRITDIESPVVESLPELDSSSAKNFKDFLLWGMKNFPSKHYLVILWGHGEGWSASPDGFGGIASDQNSQSQMQVTNLAKALGDVVTETGTKIDIFATDACLMQTIEVATELADSARFIVGSTDVVSRLGLPYRQLLLQMNSQSQTQEEIEAWQLARKIPKLSLASFDPENGSQFALDPSALPTFSLSSISSSELKHLLLPALKKLSRKLQQYLQEDSMRTLSLENDLNATHSYLGGTRDLGAFLIKMRESFRSELGEDSLQSQRELYEAILESQEALDRTVMDYAFGGRNIDLGLQTLGHKAFAIWLPGNAMEYRSRISSFNESKFYQDSEWQNWLQLIYEPEL